MIAQSLHIGFDDRGWRFVVWRSMANRPAAAYKSRPEGTGRGQSELGHKEKNVTIDSRLGYDEATRDLRRLVWLIVVVRTRKSGE